MCINYLTGWFFMDLIEAILFFTLLDKNMKKLIKNFTNSQNYDDIFDYGLNNNLYDFTVLKTFKIFKAFSQNRLLKEIYKYLDKFLFFYEWKGLLFSILVVFSSLHLCTCFFIFIGRNEFQGWIIQNNLQDKNFADLYIKNFQFFKSFENSDFFVKIVTSLKPILSMKDDILIQEGDIIEDIIFIKKGVLTLEIIIDLNEQKKSLLSHLEMTGMSCFKSISNQKFTELINNNSLAAIYQSDFSKPIIFNDQYTKKKELKIIDLRKNEHFGDILMILNEKSPVAVKVKSKKAELFFLQKTEATEISNRYSNIWKRIVNRSLHNMK